MCTVSKIETIIYEVEDKRNLPDELETRVFKYWKEQLNCYPQMFNGPLYSVKSIENKNGNIVLKCEESDYAHYKYSESYDMGEYTCRSTYAGCLLVSNDEKIFVSLNGTGSEFVGKIQFIGGVIDPDDRGKDNRIDPVVTAFRELEEEAGKEIRDSIVQVGESYLITDGKKIGVQTILHSKMDAKEILSAFDSFKKLTGNNEIHKLVAFDKSNKDFRNSFKENQDIGVIDLLSMVIEED